MLGLLSFSIEHMQTLHKPEADTFLYALKKNKMVANIAFARFVQ